MAGSKPQLTRLEAEVMAAVWKAHPQPVRVRDVVATVNAGRGEALAYTTVQTMLNILRGKGYLSVDDSAGRAHLYRAQVSQEDASRRLVGDLVDRIFSGRVKPLLQMLVDDPRLDAAELAALRRTIDEKLRDAPTPGPGPMPSSQIHAKTKKEPPR